MSNDFLIACKKANGDINVVMKELGIDFSQEQIAWLAGYCKGVADANIEFVARLTQASAIPTIYNRGVSEQSARGDAVTVLYASHSGNGKGFSKEVIRRLESAGYRAKAVSMLDYNPRELKKENYLLVIISTHGEGVPPGDAEEFFDYIFSGRAPKLDGLKYSVLALGDKSYIHFCKAGINLDNRLAELGAQRICDRIDCDADFKKSALAWLEGIIKVLGEAPKADIQGRAISIKPGLQSAPDAVTFSPSCPYMAKVISKINLNGQGSSRETYHIELSIAGSGINYYPGDACGLIAQNAESLVAQVLKKLGFSGKETVQTDSGNLVLAEILKRYELTVLTTDVIRKHNALVGSSELQSMLGDVAKLKEFIYGRDFIDLVQEYPLQYTPEQLISVLRPLPARLYSIASGPSAYENDELHLLVSVLRYNAFGRNKEGVASTFWADRIIEGEEVPVYVKVNEGFRLPRDVNAPIIMVGPGTGVAPFRSFVEERAAIGAKGKSWLFFGSQHFLTDFLYQTEWLRHLSAGHLTRMNVAFSRDQEDKCYVQHKILEQAAEVYSWIEGGAYIYVCGDMKRMAPDVHSAFIEVIAKGAGLSQEKAAERLKTIKRSGRYLEDVY